MIKYLIFSLFFASGSLLPMLKKPLLPGNSREHRRLVLQAACIKPHEINLIENILFCVNKYPHIALKTENRILASLNIKQDKRLNIFNSQESNDELVDELAPYLAESTTLQEYVKQLKTINTLIGQNTKKPFTPKHIHQKKILEQNITKTATTILINNAFRLNPQSEVKKNNDKKHSTLSQMCPGSCCLLL